MTNYTLVAAAGIFGLALSQPAGVLYAETGMFGVSGQTANIVRGYVQADTPLRLKLDRLRLHEKIVTPEGKPTPQFQVWWQRHCEAIEQAFAGLADQVAGIQAAYDAAAQASAAASNANNAVVTVQGALADVQVVSDQLQAGTLNLDAVTVGGARFVNDGTGQLVAEP